MKLKRIFASLLLAGVCMGALADRPFRNHRYSSFQALPPAQSGDVVFIGNSITNMFNWWEGFGSVQKIHGRGNSGGLTQEILDNLESMIAGQPYKVFLMIGTNDLGTAGINDPARTAMQIKTIITRIRKESPATEVYYQSILPSGKRDKQKILDTNAAVKAWIDSEGAALGMVTYVDLYAQLDNGNGVLNTADNGTSCDSYDNLHLTNRGYYKWHQEIQEYMPADCQSVLTDVSALGSNLGGSSGMRSSYFGALPVKSSDVLIIGDEMIHGGEWHELLGSPDFKDRGNGWGYPGVNIANTTAELNAIFSGNTTQGVAKTAPRAVCLYAGVADCNNNSFNAGNVKAAYKNLVDGILEKDGSAPLFLMTLLPHDNATYNSNAKTLNAYMAELAAANDKVHVIDLYAATGGDSRQAEYFMEGNYVTGVGYAQLANAMAGALNPVLGTSYSAISLDDARANVARFNKRKAIGDALNNYVAIDQYKGTGLGQYSEASISTYKVAVEPAFTALQSLNPTSDTDFGAAMTTLKQNINLPNEALLNGKDWAIVAKRNGVYVSSNGVGQGVTGKAANNQNYSRWTISKRSDGSWNFRNKADNSYLVPASGSTNQLLTSAAEPSSGWSFSYSDVLGTYIISSGSIQLHNLGQTENKIANWGGGSRRNDEGCQFTLVEIEGEPDVLPITGTPHAGVSTLEDGHQYTITNRQPTGESYGFYMVSGEGLKIAANGVLPYESYGDAALFKAVQKDSKWAFYNEATGYYLVWKGDDSGTNSNKGYLDSYNSSFCDFSLTASSNCTPGFILEGKRSNGNSGAFVLATNGGLSKWSGNTERYGTGYSNVFTIAEVKEEIPSEGTEVTLSFKNGTLSGSGNYRSSWTSNSTPAVKVEAYNTTNLVNNFPGAQASADAFIVYTGNRNAAGTTVQNPPFTSKLRVSVPTGYYITGYSFDLASHDLTATGVTVTTPKGSNYTVTSTSASQSEEYVFADTEHTSFDLTLTGENKGVKFTNFKVYVKVLPADPEAGTYTVDKNNGAWTATNDKGNWASVWTSTDGKLTFTASANNMQWAQGDDNHIDARSGGTKNATYTLASTNPEYVIESYSFKAKALTSNQTWKQGSNTYTATTSGVITIADDNVDEQAVQFTLTDADNSGTLLTDFTVKLKKVEFDPALAEPEKMTVLDNAHSSVPYRIPAIASTKDGVLVVAADYRFTHADIGGGRLDLHIRRSFDYGKTWESEIIKPSNMVGDGNCTNHNDFAGFGDPCIVADRESSKMMILSCAGYPGFFQCTRDQHQRCARWYSEDNGATWTGPEFIDNQFVFEPLDNNSFGPAQGMFFGSGKIHQSRYVKVKDFYRLYASNSVRNSGGTIRNYVMYSDDFGQTWNFLGGVDAPAVSSGGDEPKVEELPDGSVLFSGRRNGAGGRNFNIFRFSNDAKTEGQWLGNTVSNANVNGITNDNACNGEIQLVPVVRKKDNQKMWLALQSVPFGSGRNNVGIFYKPLITEADYATPAAIASNWEGKHQSSWTSSCYSTMVLQGDKNIGFVYEENGNNGGYDIQYKNYSIEVITKGKYGFDPDYAMPDVVLPLHAAGYTPAAGTVEKVETITVQYNKPLTLKQANVTLGDGVVASASVEGNVLTLTLANAITSGGKHELTIPAGVVADNDAQVNDPVSITYRIIGEEQPLGDQVTSLEGISNFKTYALYNPASKGYATYAPQQSTSMMWAGEMQDMDANHRVKNTAYSVDVNHADPNSAWMIVNYKGSTYLYNVGAEKFVSVGRPTTLGDAKAINIAKIENGFTFISNEGAQNYMCASPQLDQPVTIWTNTDNGSCWQLIENPNVEEDYERCISLIDSSFLLGDANGNTTLEREDVGSLIDYLLVRREDEAPAQCDVNKDTMISIGDVARLIRRLLESAKK